MICGAQDDGSGTQPRGATFVADDADPSVTEETVDISVSRVAAAGPDCPICLEPRCDIVALACGHIVCQECRIALIEHGLLSVCPLCRYPLAGDDAAEGPQYYDDADDVELHPGVMDRIVQVDPAPVRVQGGRPVTRRRECDECLCNACGTGLGLILVVSFWIMLLR
jgi:hypothetical protein